MQQIGSLAAPRGKGFGAGRTFFPPVGWFRIHVDMISKVFPTKGNESPIPPIKPQASPGREGFAIPALPRSPSDPQQSPRAFGASSKGEPTSCSIPCPPSLRQSRTVMKFHYRNPDSFISRILPLLIYEFRVFFLTDVQNNFLFPILVAPASFNSSTLEFADHFVSVP